MNTGTPRREKPSASTISEMVLPVPVAPATRPWRLPYLASKVTGCSPLPIRISFTRDLLTRGAVDADEATYPHFFNMVLNTFSLSIFLVQKNQS